VFEPVRVAPGATFTLPLLLPGTAKMLMALPLAA
jgi:hypothetical protein